MFWEGVAVGAAAVIVLALLNRFAGQWLAERRERAGYVNTLSAEKRAELEGSESANSNWRMFRECEADAEKRRGLLNLNLTQKPRL